MSLPPVNLCRANIKVCHSDVICDTRLCRLAACKQPIAPSHSTFAQRAKAVQYQDFSISAAQPPACDLAHKLGTGLFVLPCAPSLLINSRFMCWQHRTPWCSVPSWSQLIDLRSTEMSSTSPALCSAFCPTLSYSCLCSAPLPFSHPSHFLSCPHPFSPPVFQLF